MIRLSRRLLLAGIGLFSTTAATAQSSPASPSATTKPGSEAVPTPPAKPAEPPMARPSGIGASKVLDLGATTVEMLGRAVPASVEVFLTYGYYTLGDGGGATYRRVRTPTPPRGAVRSSDGAWWEVSNLEPNVKMYGARGDETQDDTAAIQNALDATFDRNCDLYIPAGTYLVTTVHLPGRVTGGIDDRGKAIRVHGQGTGAPFVVKNPKGSVLKGTSDAPILQDYADIRPPSNGTVEIDHLRFDGTSSTPVVLLQAFYGTSSFHNNVVYQRGTGDGLKLTYTATARIYENYSFNRDFATVSLADKRVGSGFNMSLTYGSGLVTFEKNTSRGWHTGFTIHDAGGTPYSTTISNCECSTVYNGIDLKGTRATRIVACYMEGGDGGVGISVVGSYTTIRDCLIFPGFTRLVADVDPLTFGTVIEGNVISIGAVRNGVGIDVASFGKLTGSKTIVGNSIIYKMGSAQVTGLRISGRDPHIDVFSNTFSPRLTWSGQGSRKIENVAIGDLEGIVTIETPGIGESTHVANGPMANEKVIALGDADIHDTILKLPSGTCFTLTVASDRVVDRLVRERTDLQTIVLKLADGRIGIRNSARFRTAGGAPFRGPGTMTVLLEDAGDRTRASELSRSAYV